MRYFWKGYVDLESIRKDVEREVAPPTVMAEPVYSKLPQKGLSFSEIEEKLERYSSYHKKSWQNKYHTGAVYHGGKDLTKIQSRAFELFALTNPLHPDMFPFLRKMEAEIVKMTLGCFNGGPESCGLTTSGGTESIFMAVR